MRTTLVYSLVWVLLAAPLLAQQSQNPTAAPPQATVATAPAPAASAPAANSTATTATTPDNSATTTPDSATAPAQYPYPPPYSRGPRHDLDVLAVVAVCVTAIVITAMLLHHWGKGSN